MQSSLQNKKCYKQLQARPEELCAYIENYVEMWEQYKSTECKGWIVPFQRAETYPLVLIIFCCGALSPFTGRWVNGMSFVISSDFAAAVVWIKRTAKNDNDTESFSKNAIEWWSKV